MNDLTEFLLARIADDEYDGHDLERFGFPRYAARTLAECEAKRRIVEMMGSLVDYDREKFVVMASMEGVALDTLMQLATPYADHPDYREEWKP